MFIESQNEEIFNVTFADSLAYEHGGVSIKNLFIHFYEF